MIGSIAFEERQVPLLVAVHRARLVQCGHVAARLRNALTTTQPFPRARRTQRQPRRRTPMKSTRSRPSLPPAAARGSRRGVRGWCEGPAPSGPAGAGRSVRGAFHRVDLPIAIHDEVPQSLGHLSLGQHRPVAASARLRHRTRSPCSRQGDGVEGPPTRLPATIRSGPLSWLAAVFSPQVVALLREADQERPRSSAPSRQPRR